MPYNPTLRPADVPEDLADALRFILVWDRDLDVATAKAEIPEDKLKRPRDSYRTTKSKHFWAYIEVYEQGKHDEFVRGYCLRNQLRMRRKVGSQVANNEADFSFYTPRGPSVCRFASEKMTEKWRENRGNNTVFVRRERNDMAAQKRDAGDGYRYEGSFYYQSDGIYVKFHCYPER